MEKVEIARVQRRFLSVELKPGPASAIPGESRKTEDTHHIISSAELQT